MARPLVYDQPLISVSVDGRGAAWCADQWSGDQDVIDAAKDAIALSMPVPIGDLLFTADGDTPVGVTAALFAYSPGRTLLMRAPEAVLDAVGEAFPAGEPGEG